MPRARRRRLQRQRRRNPVDSQPRTPEAWANWYADAERGRKSARARAPLPDFCWRCGGKYDEDATPEDVERDAHGDPICRDCYRELFEFDCVLCCEPARKHNGCDDGSDVFAMLRQVDDFAPGLYLVLRRPYLMSPMIGSDWFIDDAINRIADLPASTPAMDVPEFACGPVCEDCQRRHLGAVRRTPRRPPVPLHRRRETKDARKVLRRLGVR